MLRKIMTAVILLSFIAGGVFAGGQQDAAGEEAAVKVKIMGIGTEERMKSLMSYLNEELPEAAVEYQFVSNDQYDSILNTQLAAGQGPDLIEVGAQVKSLAQAGYLQDLSDQEFVDRYHESGLSPFRYKGGIYATPLLSWFEGIWYNKDIFAQYDLTPPASFDEWMDIHQTLQDNGVKPQIMGAKSWEPQMKQSIAMVLNEFYSDPANSNFDEAFNNGEAFMAESWTEIVESWSVIVDRGFITPEMLGIDYSRAQDEFASGKAAMWESGPWAEGDLKAKNPEGNFGMFPIPGLSKGTGWLVGGPGTAFAINADSKVKETAYAVLDKISSTTAQEILLEGNSSSSFLKGVKSDLGPEYSDCLDAFAEGNVYCPWNNWYSAQAIIMEYGKSMQEFIAGGKSINEVLQTVDAKAAEIQANR
ncbi:MULTISPECIES: ABC transporter substrate-binding protein [unclassified Oceanispirochaeta]|uniref:ABC transporter substrate-binding protein n=1 Tax=unclassified Oceanispirochaeta TaxID=2635722 RepID=UPI000E0993FB|nr:MULTISPECIES: extracellular solute-binding protein [unclassified Oceanispirochaeta]MBF9014554.1 extracellular solute-binding protein [Oceanispirochaeta sp. M2]NPD70810.1 extracellular solute-binding protein [Oceanispirochaeta sp. M1]RDG34093.1 extracellular solute-binding protein [Oceanispirochaeta sp. M1]